MCFTRKVAPVLALATLLLAAAPAEAALVNDYSMTDDVWNPPVAAGHLLVDLRTAYNLPSPGMLSLPVLSLVAGVAPGTELGLWSAYTISGLGSGAVSSAPALLNPYLKVQLPVTLGPIKFGLVAGVQVPTQPGMEHDAALEGVAIVPVSDALSLDLNLGAGRNFVDGGNLAHLNATASYTLPSGPSLTVAAFGNFDSAAQPNYGQQLGVLFPLASGFSTDACLYVEEGASGTSLAPMLGTTKTF